MVVFQKAISVEEIHVSKTWGLMQSTGKVLRDLLQRCFCIHRFSNIFPGYKKLLMKHNARLNHIFITLGVHESSVYISGFNLGYQWTTEALKNEFFRATGAHPDWTGGFLREDTEQIYMYTGQLRALC